MKSFSLKKITWKHFTAETLLTAYIFSLSRGTVPVLTILLQPFLERLPRPPQIRQWQQAIITFNLHKALYMAIAFPGPLFQNEGRCSAFDMEIISHSHANKSHFHKKGCAPTLILKVRVFGTRKWPIILRFGGLSSTGTNPTLPWCWALMISLQATRLPFSVPNPVAMSTNENGGNT